MDSYMAPDPISLLNSVEHTESGCKQQNSCVYACVYLGIYCILHSHRDAKVCISTHIYSLQYNQVCDY